MSRKVAVPDAQEDPSRSPDRCASCSTNLLNRLYGPVLGYLGLTYPQYLVMLVLYEQQPQAVGALGTRLYLDSGTSTPLLKRMEVSGFVSSTRDPDDERRVMIGLTDKGKRCGKRRCMFRNDG